VENLDKLIMFSGISSTDYNDISEMIGNTKEKLANIKL